jgi:hypothetical protein
MGMSVFRLEGALMVPRARRRSQRGSAEASWDL